MNEPNFWYNVYLEMTLMMDLAKRSSEAWGPLALNQLPQERVSQLANIRPRENGQFRAGVWESLPRAKVEQGSQWNEDRETDEVVRALKAMASDARLGAAWPQFVVRCMTSRYYDYMGGSFYTPRMKMWVAAEHNLHTVLAKDGARYVFPRSGHGNMFLETESIVQCIVEISNALNTPS